MTRLGQQNSDDQSRADSRRDLHDQRDPAPLRTEQALRGLAQLDHRRRDREEGSTGAILRQNRTVGKPTAGSCTVAG